MGDASLLALETHSVDYVQTCDSNGQANHILSNQGEATKESPAIRDVQTHLLANQGGSIVEPPAISDVPSGTSSDTSEMAENACIEGDSKSKASPVEGDVYLDHSQHGMLKSDPTDQYLEDRELRDTLSTAMHSNHQHENGRYALGNGLTIKEVMEKNEVGSTLGISESNLDSVFSPRSTVAAMGTSNLYNQGLKDVSDTQTYGKPLESTHNSQEHDMLSNVNREDMANNVNRTVDESNKFDGTTFLQYSKVPDSSLSETQSNGEQGENSGLTERRDDGLEESTQNIEKLVNESVFKESHIEESSCHLEQKQSISSEDHLGSSQEIRKVTMPPTADETSSTRKCDRQSDTLEDLNSHTSMEERQYSSFSGVYQCVDTGKAEWLDQVVAETDTTTAVVSNNLEGWQRFDVEEGNTTGLVYDDETSKQGSNELELWEQLLEAGLEAHDKEKENMTLAVGGVEPLQSGIEQLRDQNWQNGLASPGNPFIEGLDRLSNFSETEGFVFGGNLPGHCPENFVSLPSKVGLSDSANSNEESSSGIHGLAEPIRQNKFIGPALQNTVDLGTGAQCASEPEQDTSDYSFSDLRGPALESVDVYEAPSFMSIVDLESHELFKASMPVYEMRSSVGHENAGETWEANFDLMVPSQSHVLSPQEITRSTSLPRVYMGNIAGGHGFQEQNTSLSSKGRHILSPFGAGNRGSLTSSTPELKPSALLSPKFSPIVKKVVQKVRSVPAVSMQVLTTPNKVMSPQNPDNKPKQTSIWLQCFCCCNKK